MNDKFWNSRAVKYNELSWVKNVDFTQKIIECCDFKPTDIVLDVGVGTGAISSAISPIVNKVIGIDSSIDMLNKSSYFGCHNNCFLINWDIRDELFMDCIFDKVISRHTFHHITDNIHGAFDSCWNALKFGGKFILIEGVPPSIRCKKEFTEIFKIKEDRLVFLEEDLVSLMEYAGFNEIKLNSITLKNMSVKNWIENSGISIDAQNKIYDMHLNASSEFKEDYNMSITDTDCLIDMKMAIVVGNK